MGYLPFPPSMLLGYSGLLPLSIQAALLHPYFEPSPNFRLIRAALMPLVIYITVASVPIRTLKPAEAFLHLNFPLISIPSFHIVCLAIIFAFHEGNAFKSKGTLESQVARAGSIPHRDTAPRELQETKSTTQPKTSSRREGKDSLEAHRDRKVAVKPPSIGELVKFVTALIFSPRGLQCTWSPPEHVVPLRKPISVSRFVGETLVTGLAFHVMFLFVCAFAVPSCQNPRGAYGFLTEELGLPASRLLEIFSPYFLTLVFGGAAYSGFSLLGCLFNLVEVAVNLISRLILPEDFKPEKLDPVWYPPLFLEPYSRDNLTDFWSKGWHAAFRYDFVFCGALPMVRLFRGYSPMAQKIAGLAGAMLCSAAMHEISLVAVTKVDWTFATTKMFMGQGLGIVMETLFRKLTGRKVGGPLGLLWLQAHLLGWGKPCVAAWVGNGLGRSGVPRHSEWALARYLVPFGPVLPEAVFKLLSVEFWKQFLSEALTWDYIKSLIWE